MACTISILKNSLRGDKYKKEKARVVILARNTPGQPDLHPLQLILENLKGHRTSQAIKCLLLNFCEAKVQVHITLKVRRAVILAFGTPPGFGPQHN